MDAIQDSQESEPQPPSENEEEVAEIALSDSEVEAVTMLVEYLENKTTTDFFAGSPLQILTTLSFSDNVDLRRSAALSFAEVTDEDVRQVGRETLEPVIFLLGSNDPETQRAASAALGNLAANSENKLLIVELDGLEPLIRLMLSDNVEVQCNVVGCITNLTAHDDIKTRIANSGVLVPLIQLAHSEDIRIQRNTTGVLLNLTHSEENRQQLVAAGAVPVLIRLLNSEDADVQYHCTTALSNLAVDVETREKLSQTEPELVKLLVQSMENSCAKVQLQAALALRNLANDERFQYEIVKSNGLPPLLQMLESKDLSLITTSVACVRNLSVNPQNETPIIDAGFLDPLIALLSFEDNEEVQCHAASTLRNLATNSDKNRDQIIKAGAVVEIKKLVLDVPPSIQNEMVACVGVLALSDNMRSRLIETGICDVLIPLTDSPSLEVQGNSATALANLSTKDEKTNSEAYMVFHNVWDNPAGGLHSFLFRFLSSPNATFQHIAVWTIVRFLESGDPQLRVNIRVSTLLMPQVRQLAQSSSASPTSTPSYDDADGGDKQSEIVPLAQYIIELVEGEGAVLQRRTFLSINVTFSGSY